MNCPDPHHKQRHPVIGITPASPWQNGCIESFNATLGQEEVLKRETFNSLKEAKVLIERWRIHDNLNLPPSLDAFFTQPGVAPRN